ncbi:MAG: 2,3-bisphosphoglycerate-independent phosphoglycerate mutase, partial [Bacteroidetes bacterium]|nr:2,3-bisphosphoglycerate-independent phosphoglycerate mutase [Bacteroidota bacterium]
KKAYDLLVFGKGTATTTASESVRKSYAEGITDEFIEPIVVTNPGTTLDAIPVVTISEGDVVIFFNFRTDRGRELTEVLSQRDHEEHQMKKLSLYYVTMANYDDSFNGIKVIYEKENLQDTLGEIIEKNGKTQIRIAETEKYPHVTFFFNGGREEPFEGEKRILCPSPKVATYDLKPEMSAYEVRDSIIPEIEAQTADFICLNFANPDMVGHTGVMEAAIKACEVVDSCTEKIVKTALKNDYVTIIIADHGNSETMRNPDGSPNTAHTTNPVPVILVDNDKKFIKNGILSDIAPTILDILGIEKPESMSQQSLIQK